MAFIAPTFRVEMDLSGGSPAWTDVTADVQPPLDLRYGITGNGPLDRVADLGILTFSLRNDAGNSGGAAGYYSPLHANCRSGFTYGVKTRVVFTYDGTDYPRFYGKIASIDPEPGIHRGRRVRVVVHDLMEDLIEADLRNVTLQVQQTETELLTALVNALPADAQPVTTDFDTGLDTIPYAFDDLGAGAKAIGPAADIVTSALGFLYYDAEGALVYENRQARQLKQSTTIFADDMIDLVMPSTLDGVYNHVRATYHPKTVDDDATTVLWSQTGVPPTVGPGETVDIWGEYYKATDPEVRIGGTDQIQPAATTDYTADDGASPPTDKTAQVDVAATYFASTVKFTVTNNDAATITLTKLQCRGKGLYDLSPVTVESVSTQPYGDRALNIDLPYQSDFNVTQGLADYLRTQYESLANQATLITFNPHRSDEFMTAALATQVGDRVTISETQTGLTLADVFVNGIDLHVEAPVIVRCTFGLASASYFDQVWIMDDADLSLMGTSTYFGFA